jgi:hypothetical protein
MIELDGDQLLFRFPEVHADALCRIEFQRTLRIPDDNREHFLPPGLGQFSMLHIDDYSGQVPDAWRSHGGVFLPMYQAEAMWINFQGSYPMVVKVAAGKIDALTGEPWKNALSQRPQDYLVVPDQPWLDGFCVAKGLIRQFVAMPLGEGYTAEEQLTGEAEHGGVQIVVYPMKALAYEDYRRRPQYMEGAVDFCIDPGVAEMGLAPGGLMRQKIFEDSHGFDVWDQSAHSRCFIHILNSVQYLTVTGRNPPTKPPTAKEYTDAGLPWFDYYSGDQNALEGAAKLAGLDSIGAKHIKEKKGVLSDNESVTPATVKTLTGGKHVVREGEF